MLLSNPRRALALRGALAGCTLAVAAACATPEPGMAPEAPAGGASDAQSQAVAFTDVNVIPMDRERVLEGQTVVVSDGRIAQMGPSSRVRPPAGALVVDGRGKYLMPGLSEMHAHIPPPQAGQATIDRTLFLYLAGGVTTIRGMLGHPRHLELRAQAERGEILAPRIYTSGPSVNGNSAPTPDAARRLIEEQKAAGYDFLKLHPGLTRPVFDAVDETADRVGLTFSGHVSADVGLRRALAAPYATIDHLDGYVEALAGRDTWDPQQSGLFGVHFTPDIREEQIPALAAATRAAGVWNVPTQTLLEHLANAEDPQVMARRPEMRYVSAQTVNQWIEAKLDFQKPPFTPQVGQRYIQARRRLIKELHDAGAGLLLGSDAPQIWNVPGFSVQRELQFLVDAGLTPYQALETGTRNAAVFFGAQNDWGTVAEGRAADLILLDANPLADIGALGAKTGVMVRGRWLPGADIQKRLDAIAAEVRP